jgi:hypothetical protein
VPAQKDLKRLVRSRMKKTGESYTAARLQLLKKNESDFAERAGMSEDAIRAKTGRSWSEWVRTLDAVQAAEKPHREIAKYVSSLGTPDWWSQTVTVGYERIRGLRERGQRRDGAYEASKSRTFAVPVITLFNAFANQRIRRRWLTLKITVRSAVPHKRMRIGCDDNTQIEVAFTSKGDAKSSVALTHQKLQSRNAVQSAKQSWSERLDRLGQLLG